MFTLTAVENGHSYVAAEFATLEDAYAELDRLELALEDCYGSGYSIRCAIDELKQQIDEHFASLDDTNWPIH